MNDGDDDQEGGKAHAVANTTCVIETLACLRGKKRRKGVCTRRERERARSACGDRPLFGLHAVSPHLPSFGPVERSVGKAVGGRRRVGCGGSGAGLEGDFHDVARAEGFAAVGAFPRAGGCALLDALFAEDVAAGFDGGCFEVDAADVADG